MKENSRIRFNPVTKEIEIEGSEKFVKAYFGKLQKMISGAPEKTVTIKREPKAKAAKAAPVKAGKKKPKAVAVKVAPKKVKKAAKKAPAEKKVTNIDTVVSLIKGAPEGISTAELKAKTGLKELQIWGIVNRAAKLGKIKKVKKGLYGGVAKIQE
jgi:hypothetical protein